MLSSQSRQSCPSVSSDWCLSVSLYSVSPSVPFLCPCLFLSSVCVSLPFLCLCVSSLPLFLCFFPPCVCVSSFPLSLCVSFLALCHSDHAVWVPQGVSGSSCLLLQPVGVHWVSQGTETHWEPPTPQTGDGHSWTCICEHTPIPAYTLTQTHLHTHIHAHTLVMHTPTFTLTGSSQWWGEVPSKI